MNILTTQFFCYKVEQFLCSRRMKLLNVLASKKKKMQKGKAFVRMDVTHIPVELRQLLTFFACRQGLWRSQISLFIILLCYTKTPIGLSVNM